MYSDNDRDNIWGLYSSKKPSKMEVVYEFAEVPESEFDDEEIITEDQSNLSWKVEDGKVIFYSQQVVNTQVGAITPLDSGVVDQDSIVISNDNKLATMDVYFPGTGETFAVIYRIKDGRELNRILSPNKEMLAPLGAAGTTPQGGSITTGKIVKRRSSPSSH